MCSNKVEIPESVTYNITSTGLSNSDPKSPTNIKALIDKKKNKYPYCIVWTSIPCISHLLPFIGHTGICTSNGEIHDFAGSYTINIDEMAFGNPQKYIALNPSDESREKWDNYIIQADAKFIREEHMPDFQSLSQHDNHNWFDIMYCFCGQKTKLIIKDLEKTNKTND